MRSFSHWTPRYIKNRIGVFAYEALFPGRPWLTRAANDILESYLRPSDVGLEFGSGRSTTWLSRRLGRLISVEHDPFWGQDVQRALRVRAITNVDYRLIAADKEEDGAIDAAYVKVCDEFESRSLDFVLIDGIYRDYCVLKVIDKLRPCGILVIDNVNWYLPSNSQSPNSRTPEEGPKGDVWKHVARLLSGWRTIWTTSGVTDTAIFFRPHDYRYVDGHIPASA
jgi:hypothetical protein